MTKQKLFTIEGIKASADVKKLGHDQETAEDIIQELDNLLAKAREELRQYHICYGDSHNWLNTTSERLRIAREVLDQASDAFDILSFHNL